MVQGSGKASRWVDLGRLVGGWMRVKIWEVRVWVNSTVLCSGTTHVEFVS